MESMRDVDRVMEREIKKGSTPLQFEQLGFGDYSYNEITSQEKLLQVISYLLRIGEYEPFARENHREQCLHGYAREKGSF